jgi:methyl-accepting chemotaxis protein
MDDVTQQNAALVEQAAAAAESLEEQALQLVQVVTRFKLENSAAAPQRIVADKTMHKIEPPRSKSSSNKSRQMAAPKKQNKAETHELVASKSTNPDDDWKEF